MVNFFLVQFGMEVPDFPPITNVYLLVIDDGFVFASTYVIRMLVLKALLFITL